MNYNLFICKYYFTQSCWATHFTFQVDNFIDCEDDASDDEDEDSKMHDQGLLEDEIFHSSSYSPSVSSLCPTGTSKSELTTDQTRHQKENLTAGLDDKCLQSKNICYLSGNY